MRLVILVLDFMSLRYRFAWRLHNIAGGGRPPYTRLYIQAFVWSRTSDASFSRFKLAAVGRLWTESPLPLPLKRKITLVS